MTDDARMVRWRNLPMEMRLKRQWLVANPGNKNPLFQKNNQFYNASVSRHAISQWMTFEEATTAAMTHNLAIGFVLMEGENITCIDLDVKPNTPAATMKLFEEIVQSFDSYTERSIGGHGIHIWCKGNIGLGRRRDGVEIYSQNRFMICTGNVLHLKEHLEVKQPLLNNMLSQMPMSDDYSEVVLEELPQIETDEDIGRKLFENDDARMLWQGMWRELDHPSQSEGDMDLMVHLVRLSPSNEQCKRLFRQSGLGKRTKANRADYVLRTLRHARFIRQTELIEIEMGRRSAEAILAKHDAERMQAAVSGSANVTYSEETYEQIFSVDRMPQLEEYEDERYQLQFPPGALGYLAGCIYRGSIYPNVEFSVAAALTMMSAICGRSWNNSTGSGLNTYNLVVAPSGMGKDEMTKGIRRIVKTCSVSFPKFADYFHFGKFVSGQGLAKYFTSSRTSFAQITPEFGGIIKKFSNGRDENSQGLMEVMLGLYSKSSPNSMSDGLIYSDAAKNILSIESPSYTILGDTTPEVFQSINAFLLNNGFISRFNIFEYKGRRTEMNENVDHTIDPAFIHHLVMISRVSDSISTQKAPSIVALLNTDARNRYNKFKSFCDSNYNRSLDGGHDIEHHMWSRSVNRINVLATLAAILDAPTITQSGQITPPVVTEDHWDYFERIVMNDINNFKTKQESGDIGAGDTVRVKKIEMLLFDYRDSPVKPSYHIAPELQASGKIPYAYIRLRMAQQACFRTDGSFDDRLLKNTIQTLITMGKLIEVKDPGQKGMISGSLYWSRPF